ncbi:MAG: hypothetical protein VX294_00195 [Candidatus Latescibacterota bacterium]|nr:hypothetical protein [Candidatus Latescibacterota bacterium]
MNRDSRHNALVKSESSHNWHLLISIGLVLFATFILLNYHNQHQVANDLLVPPKNSPELIEPAKSIEQFSHKLFTNIELTMMEYGITTELIVKKRNVVDTVTIKVPADLPITQANLAITIVAQNLGGDVFYAVEDQKNKKVEMQIGFQGIHTTTITLQEYSKKRSTGMISVIVDSIKTVNEIISRICKIQQPLTLSLVSKNAPLQSSLEHCGHAIRLYSSNLDSLKSVATIIDQVDDREIIEKTLWDLGAIAGQSGSIVIFAQPRVNTLLALEEVLPRLERRGHQFTSHPTKK